RRPVGRFLAATRTGGRDVLTRGVLAPRRATTRRRRHRGRRGLRRCRPRARDRHRAAHRLQPGRERPAGRHLPPDRARARDGARRRTRRHRGRLTDVGPRGLRRLRRPPHGRRGPRHRAGRRAADRADAGPAGADVGCPDVAARRRRLHRRPVGARLRELLVDRRVHRGRIRTRHARLSLPCPRRGSRHRRAARRRAQRPARRRHRRVRGRLGPLARRAHPRHPLTGTVRTRSPGPVDAFPSRCFYGGPMSRTLLVTNDFPPRPGGIQSYLHAFANQLPSDDLVVYAPRWRGDSHVKFDARVPFEVVRHPTTLMLPTPDVARRATRLLTEHDCDTVWFGAAAPLALLAPVLRRAGAHRIVASTHGHEVGWSMLPAARQALRQIGEHTDTVTYVSRYTRGRFASAFGPEAGLEHLPSGVDTDVF